MTWVPVPPEEWNDLSDINVTSPAEGDMAYFDGSEWVKVAGTKADGRAPMIQSNGSVAWETPSGGGGGGSIRVNHAIGRGYTASPTHTDGTSLAILSSDSDWQSARHLTDGHIPAGVNGSFGRHGCISWQNTDPVVTFDFGDDIVVDEVRISGVGPGSGIVLPDGYTIESSPDNSAWTTRATDTGLTGGGTATRWLVVATIDDVTARYWRVTVERGGEWTALGEIEIFGPV